MEEARWLFTCTCKQAAAYQRVFGGRPPSQEPTVTGAAVATCLARLEQQCNVAQLMPMQKMMHTWEPAWGWFPALTSCQFSALAPLQPV